MKKRICALLAALLLTGAAASADGLDFLKPIWMQMMDGGDSAEASIPQDVRVTCADERLTVEQYGVILENEHAAEAHIYAVLRNVSGKRLPIQTVQMKAVGANGKALHEERYVSHLPDVIEPGETMIVSEWMYDFTKDIGKVSGIEITVETSTRRLHALDAAGRRSRVAGGKIPLRGADEHDGRNALRRGLRRDSRRRGPGESSTR